MCTQNNKNYSCRAMTLFEMTIALAIMAIVFAAILPQFRNIQNSWATKQANTETLQNARILMDHLNKNLAEAVRINGVSGPAEPNGFIEFEANNGTTFRYDIGMNNYVRFGASGVMFDLGGPVSKMQFTCFTMDDLTTPVTDANQIRVVKYETTVKNEQLRGRDLTFAGQAYFYTNATTEPNFVIEGSDCHFGAGAGRTPVLARIDDEHFLCAYSESLVGDDGYAVVLSVDVDALTITAGTPLAFDSQSGLTPALVKIDNTHYLCVYTGYQDDGWAVVLTVNPVTWTITKETPYEFDGQICLRPALSRIDSGHYLCAYYGLTGTGAAVVLTVNTTNWTITAGTPVEYAAGALTPDLAAINSTHYLCAFEASGAGQAVILTVNPATWTISSSPPALFNAQGGKYSTLAQLDIANYLCAFTAIAGVGRARLLTVDTSSWTVAAKGLPFEFGPGQGKYPDAIGIDEQSCLCAWDGVGDEGTAAVLTVNTATGAITKAHGTFVFDAKGMSPDLGYVRDAFYIGIYESKDSDGWSILFNVAFAIRP